MKIHLKKTAEDHLSLCGKWPEKNWVLVSAVSKQKAGSVCKVCGQLARGDKPGKDGATQV